LNHLVRRVKITLGYLNPIKLVYKVETSSSKILAMNLDNFILELPLKRKNKMLLYLMPKMNSKRALKRPTRKRLRKVRRLLKNLPKRVKMHPKMSLQHLTSMQVFNLLFKKKKL
jgi:hypothetical protein